MENKDNENEDVDDEEDEEDESMLDDDEDDFTMKMIEEVSFVGRKLMVFIED